ncbi:hypothetical protein FHS47_003826 [Lutibacter sp. SG786]|nr:hypothetical protein [Luteibacter sp. SG786]
MHRLAPRAPVKHVVTPGCPLSGIFRLKQRLQATASNALRSPITRPRRSGGSLVSTLEASSAQVSGRRPISTWAAAAAFRYERGGPV